jgi:hypothetical protein
VYETEVALAVLSLPETVSSVRLPSRLCVLVCVPALATLKENRLPLMADSAVGGAQRPSCRNVRQNLL